MKGTEQRRERNKMNKIKNDAIREKAHDKYCEEQRQAFFRYIDMLVDNGVEPDAIITRENGEKLKAYHPDIRGLDIFLLADFFGRLEENGVRKYFEVSLDDQRFGSLIIDGEEREWLDWPQTEILSEKNVKMLKCRSDND